MSEREQASPHGPSLTTLQNPEAEPETGIEAETGSEPEHPEQGPQAIETSDETSDDVPQRGGPRFLPGVVCAAAGLGLLCEGFAMAVAPHHTTLGQVLFFVGMGFPFLIFLTVLMRPLLGRLRVFTVAVLGLYPAVVFRMSSPLVLPGYDEHLHEQELLNLLRGSGLFAGNPILRVGPFYPGLELFTGVGIRLTALPPMVGMSLAVLVCRLLLVLLVYYGALTVSPSRRGASLVVAFYAVSPQFYEFNSQFAYQTLAVTLGLGGLVLLRRAQLADGAAARRLSWVAWLALIATAITHHATSWLVLAFLIGWAIMTPKGERKVLVRGATVMGTAVVAWTATLVAPLAGYFGPITTSITQAYTGHGALSASASTAGPPTPPWEHYTLLLYMLCCSVAALTCAWIMLSRAFHYRDRILGLLGICDLIFPVTDLAHFSPSVGALGDRLSTFLFFPLALSLSLVLLRNPRVSRHPERRENIFRPRLLMVLIGGTLLVFLGGTMLGSSPDWSRLPGPYLVAADSRGQDPETIAAVKWAAENLPPGSTITADRIPAVLLTGQARLWPVIDPQNDLEPAYLYFSTKWGAYQTAIVKGMHIDYIYVDTRLDKSLPLSGYYISVGEMPEPTRLTVADVSKFAHTPGLRAVYHHGPVTIYSTSDMGVVPQQKGFTSYNTMGAGPWDAVFGAAVVLLLHLIRRRLSWVKSTVRDIGALGTSLAVMGASIFIGGALFALRLMPGPAFTLGAIAAVLIIFAVRRRKGGQRIVPRPRFPFRLDLLIVIGVAAGVAGLAIALHAAWITDIDDVNAILRSAIS